MKEEGADADRQDDLDARQAQQPCEDRHLACDRLAMASGALHHAVDGVAPQQEPGEAGDEDEARIDQQDLAPVPARQRHQHAVGQGQREHVAERGTGDVDAHGEPALRALEPLRDRLRRADRNERAADAEEPDGHEQRRGVEGDGAQSARRGNDENGEKQRPLEADAVDESPARRCRHDVDQGPGAQNGAHGGVAQAEIAADGVDQRRHRHRQEAEPQIDQPHPAQHGPAIAMLVGRHGGRGSGGLHALLRAPTVRRFASSGPRAGLVTDNGANAGRTQTQCYCLKGRRHRSVTVADDPAASSAGHPTIATGASNA